MGGRGSGSWYRWNRKTCVEEVLRIDIRYLKKQGCLRAGRAGTISWDHNGDPAGNINFETDVDGLILDYRQRENGGEWQSVNQRVWFNRTLCNYGGERLWFLCPQCGGRVAVLCCNGLRFLCRHCYDLSYRSQQEVFTDRMMRKCRKIRTRLGASHNLFEPIWEKPKGMHWRTFDRLVREDETANYTSMFAMGLKLGIIDG